MLIYTVAKTLKRGVSKFLATLYTGPFYDGSSLPEKIRDSEGRG